VTSAGTLAVVGGLLAASLLTGSPSTRADDLEIADNPTPSPTQFEAQATLTPTQSAGAVGASAAVAGDSTGPLGPVAQATSAGSAPEDAPRRQPQSREPLTRRYSSPAYPARGDTGGVTVCSLESQSRIQGRPPTWCEGNEVSQSGTGSKLSYTFVHRVGRYPDGAEDRLRFPGAQELELIVLDSTGRVVWRWSDHQSLAGRAHEIKVEPQDEINWRTTWRPIGPDGYRLHPGRYTLRTWVTGTGFGPASAREDSFEVPADSEADEE